MDKQVIVDLIITPDQVHSGNRKKASDFVWMLDYSAKNVRESFDVQTYVTRLTSTTNGRGAQLIWSAYKELIHGKS